MNKKKLANSLLAAVLALGVVGIGYSAYQQKIKADTILPGYSTLHLNMKVTVPESKAIAVKAVAYPTSGGQRYYFKERTFTFEDPGLNNIEWYIRKIPGGFYNVSLVSSEGDFSPPVRQIQMVDDTATERLVFDLNLGEPISVSSPVSTPTSVTSPSPTPSPQASLDPITGDLNDEISNDQVSGESDSDSSSSSSSSSGSRQVPEVPTLPLLD